MRPLADRLIAAFLCLIFIQPICAQQASGTLRFRFAFGALTGTGNSRNFIRIGEDTQLKTGDKLKLMVALEQPGFVYVIHCSPSGEITLLLPADPKQNLEIARRYYLPDGARWFELDKNPGNETFYLLAATKRLDSLESLLQRYSTTPAAGKSAVATDIVSEIRRVRTQNLEAATQAERPVMIGGNVRSLDTNSALPDVNTIAVEITAKNLAAWTITIDHR